MTTMTTASAAMLLDRRHTLHERDEALHEIYSFAKTHRVLRTQRKLELAIYACLRAIS
jgi:hypothetical protein